MVRLLMLCHNRTGTGSALRARAMARWLVELGYEITLVSGRWAPGIHTIRNLKDGIREIQFPDVLPARIRNHGLSPMDMLERINFVRCEHFDIVHGFESRPVSAIPSMIARRIWKIPYLADCTDLWGTGGIADSRRLIPRLTLGKFDGFMEQFVWRQADGFSVITKDMAEYVRRASKSDRPVKLVQVGADYEKTLPLLKTSMRIKYRLPIEADIVVHAGFSSYDSSLLCETFINLARGNPNAHLLMTGRSDPDVLAKVLRAGYLNRLHDFGFVPEDILGELLACGDIMILPYSNKSINRPRFPNKFGDYLAAGRPIASNKTGDLGTIIREENIGILADDDPQSFASAIQALLKDKKLQDEMGSRARLLAETKYSWKSMAENLNTLYRQFVN